MKKDYITKIPYDLCENALNIFSPKMMMYSKTKSGDYYFKSTWYQCSSKAYIDLIDSSPVSIHLKFKCGIIEIVTRVLFALFAIIYYSSLLFGRVDSNIIRMTLLVVIIICLFVIQDYIFICRVDKFIRETLGGIEKK